MSERCEPPPELRERDGWYWLTHERWGEWPARYLAPNHPGIWPLWVCPDSNWTTPAAHREGYRYLAPVTPPAEVDALRAELAAAREALARLDRLRDAVVQAARGFRAAICSPVGSGPEGYLARARANLDAALAALDAYPAPRATAETVRVAVWADYDGRAFLSRADSDVDRQYRNTSFTRLGTITLHLDTEAEG